MAGLNTPVPNGTDIGEMIGGKLHGRNLLNDTAGADAIGLVAASPAANTLLGRLKAIADALLGTVKVSAAPLDAMVSLEAPFDITPHATNALPRPIKAISITTAGAIVFRHPDEGSDRTVTLPAGLFPLRATHIRATSTATGLTGF